MMNTAKKYIIMLLAVSMLFSLAACTSGTAAGTEPAPSAAPTEAALNVMAMIDGIPEMAEDGSNAADVYAAYTAAQSAYFELSYDEMNMVNNVGAMWKASDDYYDRIMSAPQSEPASPDKGTAEAGALLSGIWYDSSSILYKDYNSWQILYDGSVITPYSYDGPKYVESIGNGEYNIPDYGTIYPEYSMGEMRLASTEGRGCLISQTTIDKMFVRVELNSDNVSDYFSFDQIYSYTDEWGDAANYADNGQTCYAAVNKKEGSDLTYIGSDGTQVELYLKNGKRTTFYGMGLFTIDGKNVGIKGFGRARGALYFVRSEYVWKTETNDGLVSVYLNDGSIYTYYHGNYAFG